MFSEYSKAITSLYFLCDNFNLKSDKILSSLSSFKSINASRNILNAITSVFRYFSNNWISMLINRSSYNFDTSVSENDNILTLSTCYNDNEKVVLHAKLIKKETR